MAVLVGLVREGDQTPTETVRSALEAYRLQVDDDGGTIRGLVGTMDEGGQDYNLRVYVGPRFRGRGVGRRLYEAGMAELAGQEPGAGPAGQASAGRVTVRYRADAAAPGPVDSQAFFARRGYRVWYAMDELVYRGGRQPDPAVALPPNSELRAYDDAYYFDFIRLVGDAFEPMRRGHDFRPHNVFELNTSPERRQEHLNRAEDKVFLFTDGRLAGEAVVEGDFIDEVAVAPAYQGRGYGRMLTAHCVNLLLDRGIAAPRTSVVTDNEPARSMYYRMGFELVQANEWATIGGLG